MADIDVPVETAPTAVPAIVNYGDQTLPAIRAGMRRVRAPATNASDVGPGLVTWIQVDTSQLGAFIDPHMSYLEYDFQVTGLDDDQIAMLSNAGAASFIDTERQYIQGNPVEELMQYGTFVELDMDINGIGRKQYWPPFTVTQEAADGTALDYVDLYTAPRYAGQVAELDPFEPNDYMGINVVSKQTGNAHCLSIGGNPRVYERGLFHQNRVITPVENGNSIWYKACIPLHSSILGKYAKLAAPACEWSPSSFQMQITWASQYTPLNVMRTANLVAADFSANTTVAVPGEINLTVPDYTQIGEHQPNVSWRIRNINFVHKMIIMPAEIAGVVLTRQPNADTTIALRMWRHFTMPRLTAGIQSYTFIVPARIQSANAIFFIFRAENLNDNSLPMLKRYNPGFRAFGNGNSLQLRLGTEYLPTQPITGGMELYAESLKANNKLKSANGDTLVDHIYYFGNIAAKLIDSADGLGKVHDLWWPGANHLNVGGGAQNEDHLNNWPDIADGEEEYHDAYLNHICGFYIGFDTDTFTASTESSRSGLYLANNTLTLEMKLGTAPLQNYTLDCFIVHDADLVIRATGLTQTFY